MKGGVYRMLTVQYESDIHGGTVLIYNFLPEGFCPVLFLFSDNSSHCPAG